MDVKARLQQPAPVQRPAAFPVRENRGVAADLRGEARTHEAFFKAYNGRSIAEPERRHEAAILSPPPGADSFKPFGVIVTPGATGLDTTVLTLDVPHGWDGVIKSLSHNYTGGGFVDGSGLLIWRILRDGQAVKNFDSISVEFGRPAEPIELAGPGIPVYSGQCITYIVNHALLSGLPVAGSSIICSFGGYFFPRK
jgi:hypothetical protein